MLEFLKKLKFPEEHGVTHALAVYEKSLTIYRNSPEIPSEMHLDWVRKAALLHDIGLAYPWGFNNFRTLSNKEVRDQHHILGAELLQLFSDAGDVFHLGTVDEWREVQHAVREHRASGGVPMTRMAQLVSDADRVSCGSAADMYTRIWRTVRANECPYGEVEEVHALVMKHVRHKYSKGGYGTRIYFSHTKDLLTAIVEPILTGQINYHTLLVA